MAHGHDHSHDEGYFLDQIFSIALCGAIGGIATVMAWPWGSKRMLVNILDMKFHPYVFAGGITLLVLVVIRAVALWQLAGEVGHAGQHQHDHEHHHHGDCGHEHCGHDHGHEHGHDHHHHHHEHVQAAPAAGLGLPLVQGTQPAHEHAHHHHHEHDPEHDHGHKHEHDHEHDPGHDHGWAPWRYTILMLPVVLFLLNLPNDGFSAPKPVVIEPVTNRGVVCMVGLLGVGEGGPGAASVNAVLAAGILGPNKYGGDVVTKVNINDLRFSELEQAAYSSDLRAQYTGKAVTIIGKFVARDESSSQFSLVRYKMNCCAADALPLNAVLMVNPSWQGARLNIKARQQKWVKVTGRVHFIPVPGRENDFVPAILLFPAEGHEPDKLVEIIDQPPNPYAT
jgi:hypothetical protein